MSPWHPLVLWGLDRQRTRLVLGTVLCVYVLTQLNPEAMSLDVSAFRHLAANSPLFFGAVVLGYHRQAVGAWWQSHRAGRVVDAVVVVVGAVLFVGFVLDYGGNEAVQEFLGSFVVREFLMPPHSLLIVLVYLRILWLLTTRLWSILHRLGGWLFMPFGQDSMFAYCMQAGLIVWFHQLDTPIDEDSHAVLRLAGEAVVVGLMLGHRPVAPMAGPEFRHGVPTGLDSSAPAQYPDLGFAGLNGGPRHSPVGARWLVVARGLSVRRLVATMCTVRGQLPGSEDTASVVH